MTAKHHFHCERHTKRLTAFGPGSIDIQPGLVVVNGREGRFVWNQHDVTLMVQLLSDEAPRLASVLTQAMSAAKLMVGSRRE